MYFKFIMFTDNNQIFRNWFVIIHRHLTKVSSQINKCIIFGRNELSLTLFTLWYNPVHPLNSALPGPYVPARVTHGALLARRYTYARFCLAAEPCSTAGLLFPSWCPSGTILLTPYSMVWDWRVSRVCTMILCWNLLLYPYYSLLLFLTFSSLCLLFGIVGLGSSD